MWWPCSGENCSEQFSKHTHQPYPSTALILQNAIFSVLDTLCCFTLYSAKVVTYRSSPLPCPQPFLHPCFPFLFCMKLLMTKYSQQPFWREMLSSHSCSAPGSPERWLCEPPSGRICAGAEPIFVPIHFSNPSPDCKSLVPMYMCIAVSATSLNLLQHL